MLRRLEDALRAALEAPFAQLFPDKLHPVEMAAALRKAMDQSRLLAEAATYAHNRYTLRLDLQDYERLSRAIPTLEREFTEHLGKYAAAEGLIVGPYLQVRVEPDESLASGQLQAQSDFSGPIMAYLEVVGGLPERGRLFEVHDHVVLGRGSDCDICLQEAAISRHHAEILWQYVIYQVRDLGSANGTFVNGRQVLSAPLNEGDLLELGLVQLRFTSR